MQGESRGVLVDSAPHQHLQPLARQGREPAARDADHRPDQGDREDQPDQGIEPLPGRARFAEPPAPSRPRVRDRAGRCRSPAWSPPGGRVSGSSPPRGGPTPGRSAPSGPGRHRTTRGRAGTRSAADRRRSSDRHPIEISRASRGDAVGDPQIVDDSPADPSRPRSPRPHDPPSSGGNRAAPRTTPDERLVSPAMSV